MAAQFARFCSVGVLNTLVTLGVFWGLGRVGAWYPAASTVAFLAGAVNSYALNRRWTFRRRGSLARFVAVQALGMALGVGILAVAVAAGAPHLAGQALAVPPVSVTTFGLARRLVFVS